MSRIENQVVNLSERVRLNNVGIQYYMKEKYETLNQGYIDENKRLENTRILALNPNGLNPWDEQKMNMFVQSCTKNQIDIALLNEMNVKWTPAILDKIEL